jgi:thiol:disulfide interchange protein/DsbC/DsbD-like thiol-disulfide interchange protein
MLTRVALTVLLWFAALSNGAAPVKTEHVEAELIAERAGFTPGAVTTVALRLKMQEHWHTYWKNPGDSGLPTKIAWKLPPGFEAGPIQWPHPQPLPTGPLMNYGYDGEVLLLTDIKAPADLPRGANVAISARADWLVCKDVCIPENAKLALTLPVVSSAAPPNGVWQRQFAATRAAFPQTLSNLRVEAGSDAKLLELKWNASAAQTLSQVRFFPERGDVIQHAAKQDLLRDGDGYRLRIPLAAVLPKDVNTIAGVLVADAAWDASSLRKAAAIDVPLGAPLAPLAANAVPLAASTAAPAPATTSALPATIGIALAFAFIGGLILNLMPCVFPVLGIKIVNFVERAHADHGVLRKQGWLFTLGALAAFMLLAGVMLALRAGGMQIGWGFQLQSPLFVSLLACLFFLLALNLSGVFEVGAAAQRLAGNVAGKDKYADAFLSGVLAAVVATPCTAPFMGAAIGYTLAQPVAVTLAIFAALALGMALPVLLLSWFPQWLGLLPKPGRWMETFKQVMAFPLYATVIWLAWVLGAQAGNDAVLRLLLGLLVLGMAAWIYGRWSLRGKALPLALAGLMAVAGLALAWPGKLAPSARATAAEDAWQSWSQDKVAQLRAQGKPVFVDFTAAWCITCQVNKRVALNRDEVMAAFKSHGVALLRADWTAQDPAITQALAALGRNAVPVYALYPADSAAPPQLLPEVLTPSVVVQALQALPVSATAQAASR